MHSGFGPSASCRDLRIVFVAQQGPIEQQALLLAASLRRHLGTVPRLMAAIPTGDSWMAEPLAAASMKLFDALVVELLPFTPPMVEYPNANKIGALIALPPGVGALFLDSDLLCLRPFASDAISSEAVALRPADRPWAPGEPAWAYLYRRFGLDFPEARVRATLTGEIMPPYFNAGLVYAPDARRFGEDWLELAHAIDADDRVPSKRPWLDQISLPLAIAQDGRRFTILPPTFNHPTHHAAAAVDTVLAHYHDLEHVFIDRRLSHELRAVLERLPALCEAQPELMSLDAVPSRVARVYAGIKGKQSARRLLRRLRKLSRRLGRSMSKATGMLTKDRPPG